MSLLRTSLLRTASSAATSITTTTLSPSLSLAAARTSSLLLNSHAQTRTLYKKAVAPPKHYTKLQIDEKVLEMLFDYTKVSHDKVSLEANIVNDLTIGRLDRFGLYWDLQTEFEFFFLPARSRTRELASGREAADWVASILEEEERLVV
ncbi:hypothetical protein HKX48_000644 [Thoreauomyces humboldtii]|nr:hypothetical protein HKX48_000644 [Thoreauomyces humboldtii]